MFDCVYAIQESLIQCQWNIDTCFEQRLRQIEQYKEDEESSDNASTPTEVTELFFQEFQKPHSKSKSFTPAEDGSREH